MYKFKEIQTIPTGKQLVDIVLSKTNRKTPTVVHVGYKITRIRSFYMRKVKFCQTTYSEKFGKILDDFPKIDDIHPFYADLCNVLYDRDHYKLALGQVNASKKIIDTIAKEYVRMMKFGDTLYKCKMLKRAALGRMCTTVKKLSGTLTYLEEVRQHLGRLPSINPATRTLILTGYPNVGKSSFMNIVTNANVDVQPYSFTTKSLFIGHLDHNYVRWQVIDTPGILDHPLEDRNTIEMTAITALAHLPAAILFFVDVSETCGYSLKQQVALFESIKPLFRNRPLLIVLNKIDLKKTGELSGEEKTLIESMKQDHDGPTVQFFETSCATKEGVDAARTRACDLLLEKRVEQKGKLGKWESLNNRLHVTGVKAPANRPAFIPPAVQQQREAGEAARASSSGGYDDMLEKDRMEELGGAGVYSVDIWRKAILEDPSWKYDMPPEVIDGHNVADFIDPDIDRKLAELEKEEALLEKEAALRDDDAVIAKFREARGAVEEANSRINQIRLVSRLKKSQNHVPTPRKARKKTSEVAATLKRKGFDDEAVEKVRGRSRSRGASQALLKKRKRDSTEGEGGRESSTVTRFRSKSRAASGVRDEAMAETIEKSRRKKMRLRNKKGIKGEADKWIPDLKPKHLYSGKRGIGKTDRR